MPMRGSTDPRPLHSQESEKVVLGCILRSSADVPEILSLLPSSDAFVSEAHKIIFEAIRVLHAKGRPADLVTVIQMLDVNGTLAGIGGRAYLTSLCEQAITTTGAKEHAMEVVDKHHARELSSQLGIIQDDLYHGGTFKDAIAAAEASVYGLAQRSNGYADYVHVSSLTDGTIQLIDDYMTGRMDAKTRKTGFYDLDKILEIHPGHFIVIAARPSMGKTAFALNVAENVAVEQGIPVGIFSLEMSAQDLYFRMLCSRAKISRTRIVQKELTDPENVKLVNVAQQINAAPIYIDETTILSPAELRSKVRRMVSRDKVGLVIIDYIQLMSVPGVKAADRVREVGIISRECKAIAKEFSIPVIGLAQLSRQAEMRANHRPGLSDLRESGSIEQDADAVGFIYRPGYYDPKADQQIAEIIIGKNRHGATGMDTLRWTKDIAKFSNLYKRNFYDEQRAA